MKSMRLLKKISHASARNCRYPWIWVDTFFCNLNGHPNSLNNCPSRALFAMFLVCADFESHKPFLSACSHARLLALGVGLVAAGFYRIYLHPLAKFPRPKLAALSHWYEAYYDVLKKGQYTFEIERMHQKYGKHNISLLPCWKGLLPLLIWHQAFNSVVNNPCKPRCLCPTAAGHWTYLSDLVFVVQDRLCELDLMNCTFSTQGTAILSTT